MSRKVTLTVSDELYERIDQHRGRLHLSAIFTAAVERALSRIDAPSAEGDLGDVIERLREQRREMNDASFRVGFEEGTEYAKTSANYNELLDFSDSVGTLDWRRSDAFHRLPKKAQDHVRKLLPHHRSSRLPEGQAFWHERYYQGFGQGMLSVWNAVADDLDE